MTDQEQPRRFWWLEIGCLLLVIAAALHSSNRSIGGGDTWVAMANGRYTMGPWAKNDPGRTWQMEFLDLFGMHLTQKDYMGAKTRDYVPGDKEKIGWVNQNWLTHVQFFLMREHWGENSIVLFKFLQSIATALLAYWTARLLGAHPALAAAAVAFGMLLSRSFNDLRPNQSTIFYAAAMLTVLAYWRQSRKPAVMLWLIPILLLWTNIHGGFIYAIMIFAVMLAGHFIPYFLRRYSVIAVILGFLACLVLLFQAAVIPKDKLESLAEVYQNWRIAACLAVAGIVIVLILLFARLGRLRDYSYVTVSRRHLCWLLSGGAMTILIPGLCSPFGWENVVHPLLVAIGKEGAKWRNVVEWRPIWDPDGFGNNYPYCWFLGIFAVLAFAWMILFLRRPQETLGRRRRGGEEPPAFWWPQLDLAFIGVIVITMIMSIKSRRFIFLGGVILAPFMAQLASDIGKMIYLKLRQRHQQELALTPLPQGLRTFLATIVWIAAAAIAVVFAACMHDVYYRPAADGLNLSVFRRMVGIPAQPVEAIKFFDLNKLEGVVFNEWVNGGFITFFQTPQPENGQVLCKVHMDGRAQAAYDLDHFLRWNLLKVALPRGNPDVRNKLFDLGRQFSIDSQDPLFYRKLIDIAYQNQALARQLEQMAGYDPKLYCEFQRRQLQALITKWGFKADDPDLYHKLVARALAGFKAYPLDDIDNRLKDYKSLAVLAPADAALYDAFLQAEDITVVLLDEKKGSSYSTVELLNNLPNWRLYYLDDRNCIYIRGDGVHNQALWNAPDNAVYADETARLISQGVMKCFNVDPVVNRQGLQLLFQADFDGYIPRVYDTAFETGLRLGMVKETQAYFEKRRDKFKQRLDAGEPLGRSDTFANLLHSAMVLERLAQLQRDSARAKLYRDEFNTYKNAHETFMNSLKEGLLW